MPLNSDSDGHLLADYREEDGRLYRRLSIPNRVAILEENRELQRNPDALRKMEGMGVELRIPEPDYYMLLEKIPALNSPDREIQLRAWHAFLGSSASDPYRLKPRVKKNGLAVAVAGASLVSQL